MDLNLKIQPLSALESFCQQKCLIPATKFPKVLKPGSWCKCYRGNNGGYSVCQVFPRSNIPTTCCVMDHTVVKVGDESELQPELLTELELLNVAEVELNEPASVTITFIITEQLFARKLDKITLNFLKQTASYYLQSLELVAGCQVQIEDLMRIGIAAINIDSVPSEFLDSNSFMIGTDTKLLISDVQLFRPQVNSVFYAYGFEQAQQNLRDLLQVTKMQKNCKWQMHPSLNALLVGSAGSGKTALAHWFINEYSCNCFSITAANVLGQYPGETEAALRQKFNAVKTFVRQMRPQFPTVLLLEDLQLLCPAIKISASDAANALRTSTQLLSLVDDLHAARLDVMCLATTSAPESLNELARRPGRFEREITIAKPSEQQRSALFRALFDDSFFAAAHKRHLTNDLLETVAKQTQGFVIADLELLIRKLGQRLLRRDRCLSFGTELQNALKQAKPISMRSTDLTVCKTDQRFDSIGGMQQLKRTLEASILAGLKQQAAFQRFGLTLPKGVLLYGPPGCAKTSIAKCLATEANMTFIATSGAEVYSPYVGCAEKFIAKIFDTARKHAPCLIFLDEIDSLVGRRSSDSKGDIQIRILSTLLTEMDGIVSSGGSNANDSSQHILVVAATNRPDMLDDALMRPGRFDKLIHVPAPDFDARLAILKLYAARMPFADDVDLAAVASKTENYSGADICNLCNEAALHALTCNFDAVTVGMQDFVYVLKEQKSSLTQSQIQWYLNLEKNFVS